MVSYQGFEVLAHTDISTAHLIKSLKKIIIFRSDTSHLTLMNLNDCEHDTIHLVGCFPRPFF